MYSMNLEKASLPSEFIEAALKNEQACKLLSQTSCYDLTSSQYKRLLLSYTRSHSNTMFSARNGRKLEKIISFSKVFNNEIIYEKDHKSYLKFIVNDYKNVIFSKEILSKRVKEILLKNPISEYANYMLFRNEFSLAEKLTFVEKASVYARLMWLCSKETKALPAETIWSILEAPDFFLEVYEGTMLDTLYREGSLLSLRFLLNEKPELVSFAVKSDSPLALSAAISVPLDAFEQKMLIQSLQKIRDLKSSARDFVSEFTKFFARSYNADVNYVNTESNPAFSLLLSPWVTPESFDAITSSNFFGTSEVVRENNTLFYTSDSSSFRQSKTIELTYPEDFDINNLTLADVDSFLKGKLYSYNTPGSVRAALAMQLLKVKNITSNRRKELKYYAARLRSLKFNDYMQLEYLKAGKLNLFHAQETNFTLAQAKESLKSYLREVRYLPSENSKAVMPVSTELVNATNWMHTFPVDYYVEKGFTERDWSTLFTLLETFAASHEDLAEVCIELR